MMLTRTVPSSGESLPVVGLGTWQVFDCGAQPTELQKRRAVVDKLFAAGGSVIDSSPMYGRAEQIIGAVLDTDAMRARAFLATKVWTQGREAGIKQMAASMQKMRAGGTLDLMQIHNLVDWRTHLPTLRGLKAEGRIRYIGITHYTQGSLDDLADVIEREQVDFVQAAYSLGMRTAERRLLPLAQDKGVAVIANMPLGTGKQLAQVHNRPLPDWAASWGIESWPQFALKYVLSHPPVTCVIPATSNATHMGENAAAGTGRLPSPTERERMAEYWDTLSLKF
jgi:diketogulonate reductase-like aldo/keto reductase